MRAFAAAHGIDASRPDATDVEAVRRLREALREVCAAHTGVAVPSTVLDLLRRLLARGPLRLEIDAAGAARVVPGPAADAAGAVTAAVAAAIASGSADGTWARLKACAADGCRWVYYDHSRPAAGVGAR